MAWLTFPWRSRQARRRAAMTSGAVWNYCRPKTEELESRWLPSTVGVYDLEAARDLQGSNPNIPAAVLANPNVDGIALRANWNFLEPGHRVYNWANLDTLVGKAVSAGKKFSLSINVGINTPDWVYAGGAQRFTFFDPNTNQQEAIPVPWDSVFLADWEQFVRDLGARYARNPALTHVKVTGLNENSAETILPHESADVANWQAVGYTRTRVENAWQSIADTFSRAFPHQQIANMINPSGFPPIDNNGNVITDGHGQLAPADYRAVNDLISLGIARYGAQYIVQNNALSDFWISSQVANVSGQVTTGYQMLWYVTNDSTYRMNQGTPIDPASELGIAVNQGIAANARFLEIYRADILNPALQGVIQGAHGQLTGAPNNGSGRFADPMASEPLPSTETLSAAVITPASPSYGNRLVGADESVWWINARPSHSVPDQAVPDAGLASADALGLPW